ncbi:MAG TPA: glycoside hydrolase family 3 N-terminal domain-containing protein, partial [Spirochaetota bacterium]|nr:glycoside hydrolase family 3 N-terminal domain-containing protein [Spirochaetota bacterium]
MGQCFTFMWSGHLLTPAVVESITELHCGNLRLQPFCLAGKRLKYYKVDTATADYQFPDGVTPIAENLFTPGLLAASTPAQYASRLNKLQEIAMARSSGLPLGFSIDQEGCFSRDYCYGGINLFPSAMGLTAADDLQLVYKVNKAVALQLSAMGINIIHSPVLDINVAPQNPEIGIRSFGDDPARVGANALKAMQGLKDGGLITTGKHFPGRGDSRIDAHFGKPVLEVDRSMLKQRELVPYQILIENGLPSIMLAHNLYPAYDNKNMATVSPAIIKGLLREELGFEGVITTDSIAMGALMKEYSLAGACARALAAGADMVLNKTETSWRDQGFWETIKYVEKGLISREELDNKVRRILRMKWERGLFHKPQVKVKQADKWIRDKKVIRLADTAARKAAVILKPSPLLKTDDSILVIEQRLPEKTLGQTHQLHRLALTEAVYKYCPRAVAADCEFKATPDDEKIIIPLLEDVDHVIMTNHYFRGCPENNTELVQKIIAAGKQVHLIVNTPYPFSVVNGAAGIICTFSSAPESLRVAAGILFGRDKAAGSWPLQ